MAARAVLPALLLTALLLLGLLLGWGGGPTYAAEGLATRMAAEPRAWRDLVMAARDYLDRDSSDLWRTRQAFLEALERHAAEGDRVLADPDALRWLVAQARSFEKRPTQEASFALRLPPTHPRPSALRRYPRPAPLPLLYLLPTRSPDPDAAARAPLARYLTAPEHAPIREGWVLAAPRMEGEGILDDEGHLRREPRRALSQVWRRAHVDFDRFVLDGDRSAFTMATSCATFFAGLVLRGGWRLDEADGPIVANLAPLPIYVVDDPMLAADLRAAGHDDVSERDGKSGLVRWLEARGRTPARRFSWSAPGPDHVLAWWINLDAVDWEAPRRTLEAEVLDTEADPNTVDVRARGIETVSLFLNDGLVDLDRPVRVRLNGRVVHDERLEVPERMASAGRDLDTLFDRDPVRIRQSLYYGWLYPARLVMLPVPPPPVQTASPPAEEPGPAAVPEPVAPPPRRPTPEGPGVGWWWIVALAALVAIVIAVLRRR